MEALISTFHIDWKLMIAQIINFVLVFCALYLLAAKPLRKLIAERTEEIHVGLNNAKENAKLLENTKKDYESVILQAKQEAHELFKSTKEEASSKKVEMIEEAKKEVETLIENTKKELEAEKKKMLNDTKNEIADLIVKTTAKIINEQLPHSAMKEIVNDIEKIK